MVVNDDAGCLIWRGALGFFEQARSYHHQPITLWERACPRRRRHIQHHCRLTLRLREQARSHIGKLRPVKSQTNKNAR
ncbi:MAG: hypothetical protein JWQ69_4890, partial [Pseudomonas sp.]|nr:hypothetical protein [Pseudomonas sp.]